MNKFDFLDMPEIIQDYLKNYLKLTKNRSDSTIKEYYYDLREIFQFIFYNKKKIKDVDYKEVEIKNLDLNFFANIELNDIYDYLYEIDIKPISRARKISAIKSFYNYLCNIKKIVAVNPCVGLESPKIGKRLPKYLKLDEATSLLRSIDGEFKSRDYAIITLFLNCGLRLSELVNINTSHIRDDLLNIIGKGNKERSIHLNFACTEAINNYLKERPKDGVIDRDALFLSKQLKRISPRMVEMLVKKHVMAAGLDYKKYTPHKLRHTAATLMHKYGKVDIRALQQILGHESISTTDIYTHVDSEEVRNAIDSNPLNKIR